MRSDAQPQKIRLAPLASGLSVVGQRQRRGREAPRLGHRPGLRRHEQAAGRHQHEHHVQHVELRRAQHLHGRELMRARSRRDRRRRRPARAGVARRMPQELRDDQNDHALEDAGRRQTPLDSRACAMIDAMNGMKSAVPPPNPAAMIPDASPRRSVNHLSADPIEPL